MYHRFLQNIIEKRILKRIFVIEKVIHSLRKHEENNQMSIAAEEMYSDYSTDKELTVFTNIDFDDYYEAK